MSGHSKWSTIKHKKGKADAKRGKVFTKIIREITVSAREGGSDADSNPRLRAAVAAAKASNMPADNIKRAIQRGTGELPGMTYEEFTFEGYGPGGVAVMLQIMTDNRNRTTPEIRHLFSKHGGNLGENGCVSWLFTRKGSILVPRAGAPDEDAMMEIALEAGADDLDVSDADYYSIATRRGPPPRQGGSRGAGRRDRDRRVRDGAVHHRPSRGQAGAADAAPDGGLRRPRRRPERLGELRHRRRHHGQRLRPMTSPASPD